VLVLGSQLIFGNYEAHKYIFDIENNIKLVQGWYHLRSMPSWFWYKVDIAISHTSLVRSLLLMLIGLYIKLTLYHNLTNYQVEP